MSIPGLPRHCKGAGQSVNARHAYLAAHLVGRSAPLAERLQFAVPSGGTEDPDEGNMAGAAVRQTAAKVKDVLTGPGCPDLWVDPSVSLDAIGVQRVLGGALMTPDARLCGWVAGTRRGSPREGCFRRVALRQPRRLPALKKETPPGGTSKTGAVGLL